MVAWRMGVRVLGLVSTLTLVRLLAPADFGLVALASSFMQAIDAMLTLGTEEAVIREKAPGRDVYDTAFTLNVLRGLLIGLAVALAAFPAARFFDEPRLGPVLLAFALVPAIDGLTNIGTVDFRRDFAFNREFAIMVLPKAFGIVMAIAAAFALHSYLALLAGVFTNRTLRMAMSYRMHPYRPRLCLRAWRLLGGYSFWTWALGLAVLLRDRADTLLIGRLLNPAAVGLFAVGAEIAALPTTELVEPLCRAAFPAFARARHDRLPIDETWRRLVASAALLTLPAGVGLALVASPLVRLAFGPAWLPAVPVLQLLGLSGTLMVFGQISFQLISAHALLGRLLAIAGTAVALRVALLLALIPPLGLAGAAWAALLTTIVEQSVHVGLAMRHFRLSGPKLLGQTWRCGLATAAMALGVLALGPAPDGGPLALALSCALAVGVGAALYAAVLGGLWLLSGRPAGAEADLLAVLRHIKKSRS